MIIKYNQLDETQKSLYFLSGIYSLEHDSTRSWMWTSDCVDGEVYNIDYITIHAFSEIENTLMFEKNIIEIKPRCLNILKFKTKDKVEFSFKLKNIYNPIDDSRNLGIRIIRLAIDGEIIF